MNHGSEVHCLCDKSLSERLRDFKESGFDPNDLENITLIHFEGTPLFYRYYKCSSPVFVNHSMHASIVLPLRSPHGEKKYGNDGDRTI